MSLNANQVRAAAETMLLARLQGHELRLRALGGDGMSTIVKLYCERCLRSREERLSGDAGPTECWGEACVPSKAALARLEERRQQQLALQEPA